MKDEDDEDQEEQYHVFTLVSRNPHWEVQIHRSSGGRYFVGYEDPFPTTFLTLEDAIQKAEDIEVDGNTESVWCPELASDEVAKLLRVATHEYSRNPTTGHKFTINDQVFKVEWRKGIVRAERSSRFGD